MNIPDNILQAPHLAPAGVGEYTDEELAEAATKGYLAQDYLGTARWLRAFLAALPRRESPPLAEAIARAEPAEEVPIGPEDCMEEAFSDMLAALEAINAHWESGNFSRQPHLWEPMKAAIIKANAWRKASKRKEVAK